MTPQAAPEQRTAVLERTRPTTLVAPTGSARETTPGTRIARTLLVLAAFTSTWNAVSIGSAEAGIKPVDLLLAAATVVGCVALAVRWRPLPVWLWLPAVAVVVVTAVHVVFPTPEVYLGSRTALDAVGAPLAHLPDGASTVAVVVRWLIAMVVLPFLVINLYGKQRASLDLLVWAWAAGAAVSGLVSVTDFLGLTQIGPGLIGYAEQAGRQTGLSIQPNHLGFSCALTAPAALHLFRRHRVAGAAVLVLLLSGILVSGSRGAQLTVVVIACASLVLFRDARRALPLVAYGAAFALLPATVFSRHILDQVGEVLRFGGDAGASGSDSIRVQLLDQAGTDWLHRPVFGVGYQVLLEAHSIYVQVLAAGGIVLLLAFVTVHVGALLAAYRLARAGEVLAPYLFASVLTWVVCGLIENQVTDRYLYFPVAAIAALAVSRAVREP